MLTPEELLTQAIGCLDEAFSALCKLRNRAAAAGTDVVSQALRRTLKTIESLEEVPL